MVKISFANCMLKQLIKLLIIVTAVNFLNAREFNQADSFLHTNKISDLEGAGKLKYLKKSEYSLFGKDANLQLMSHSSTEAEESQNSGRNVFHDLYSTGEIFVSDFWYVASAPGRLDWKSTVWLSGFTLVSGILYAYDQEILDAFRRSRENFFYKLFIHQGYNFERMGHMGVTNKFYFLGLGVGYVFNVKPLTTIMAQILESHFIAGSFKNLANIFIGRHRPFEGYGPYSYSFNDGTSFPSGHASNIFQVATVLSHHVDFLPFDIVVYGLASSVAFQRIDSRNHWPSDVFIAAIYGTLVSRAVLSLHEKRKVKIVPQVNSYHKSFGINFLISL